MSGLFGWPSVTAQSAVSFKNWGAFSSATETRRNITGSTVVNAPIKFVVQFHKGELPTTSTLQLRDPTSAIVPTTDWQFSERVTYPDGSLMAAVVCCYGPASWADAADKQWTFEAISGSWPAETSSGTVSHITAASAFQIVLEDVRRIGPNYDQPGGNLTQPAHSNPTLTFDANNALGRACASKRSGGAIRDQWVTWGWFRNSTPTDDSYLWCKLYVECWYVPSSSTVRHISFHPIVNNGWAIADGRAFAYKAKVLDGATTLYDYTKTRTITSANIDISGSPDADNSWNVGIAMSHTPFYPGTAVYVASGTPPANVTVGKIYECRMGSDAGSFDHQSAAELKLANLGYWGTAGYIAAFDHLDFADAGGTWVAESRIASTHQRSWIAYDGDGFEFWAALSGGAKIAPNWTRAEKIRRMQVGQISPVQLDNGAAAGSARGDRKYHPGSVTYHRTGYDVAGGIFQRGYHIGELGTWGWDVLLSMSTRQHHLTLRRAAAESQTPNPLGQAYDERINGSTSLQFAEPIVFNNGADKAGSQYSGLGPSKPGLSIGSFGNYPIQYRGICTGDYANNLTCIVSNGVDGTHSSQAMGRAYELYPDPVYRELSTLGWIGAQMQAPSNYTGNVPSTGVTDDENMTTLNKRMLGTTYYRITIPGLLGPNTNKREFIGTSGFLKCAMYNPDASPLGPFVKDVAADIINFCDAFYGSSRMGSRAKDVGPLLSLESTPYYNAGQTYATSGVTRQSWIHARLATVGLRILKQTGIESTNALKWFTAASRMLLGDSFSGVQMPHLGAIGTNNGISMTLFDNPERRIDGSGNPTQPIGGPQNVIVAFPDTAATVANASTVGFGEALEGSFLTDGSTFDVTNLSMGFASGAWPNNGDFILFQTYGGPTPPAGINQYQNYYLYNRSGSGSSRQYNLSTTPGPSYTAATWTPGGGSVFINQSYILASNTAQGGYAGGFFSYVYYEAVYQGNICEPVPTALTLFGAESGCSTASTNWEAWKDYLYTGQSVSIANPATFLGAHNIAQAYT